MRNMKRHGIKCEAMNMNPAVANVNRNSVEERASSEKFVGGMRTVRILSCSREKSSMLFCRSRILRKKSLDSSFTGLTVGAGARAGPVGVYAKFGFCEESVVGAAGCRAMKEGMRRARRRIASGRTERRNGSRQTNVYIARKETVCELCFQDRRRMTFDWKTKTTPILALKRRKLVDIVVMLNEGLSVVAFALGL